MEQFSLHYSDDNKTNTFNNGGNEEQGLKNVKYKQTLTTSPSAGQLTEEL